MGACKALEVWRLGRMSYEQSVVRQERLVAELRANRIQDTLLSLQHPSCFTMGMGRRSYKPGAAPEAVTTLLTPLQQLHEVGLQLHHSQRSGDITFHGPGQAILYPIISLRRLGISFTQYVSMLEATLVKFARSKGLLDAEASLFQGCWVGAGRRCIGCIGVHVDARGITSHGLSFNINTDLSFYQHIVPCGIFGKEVTSLARELGCASLDEDLVTQELIDCFVEVFGFTRVVFKGLSSSKSA